MAEHTPVNPPSLARPVGYSYAVRSQGEGIVHIAGHVAVDPEGEIVAPGDVVRQFERALANFQVTVRAAGAALSDVVKLTIYVTDRDAYRANARAIGEVYRRTFGRHYPAMTLVEVSRLWNDEALVEVEGVAVC